MTKVNWEEIINKFNKTNVLVVGDAMIDSYIWGNIERNSPEAPIPIVAAKKHEKKLGGAANVALNIKSLGANPILCSVIGKNDNGFIELMNKANLSLEGIIKENRITTNKTRIISNNIHQLRVDEEQTNDIISENEFIDLSLKLLHKADVVVLQDYNKGVLTKKVISSIIEKANLLDIPTLVDPKDINYFDYKNVTLFKPNLKELKQKSKNDYKLFDIKTISKIVTEQRLKLNADSMMVTLSENGIFFQNNTEEYHIPVFKRNIIDVSGAGDSIIAILALILKSNLSNENIIKIANLCGGLACEKIGVATLNKKELIDEANRLI
jgi:rfaE bifunctional protein kinase chain/domain